MPERQDHVIAARLRETEERFRLLVESVRDYAIFMLDCDGIITSWNVGAQRIKRYAASEIIGQHFSVFYTPEDLAIGKPRRAISEAIRDGRFEDEAWRVRKGGERFWANVVITALRDESGVLRGFAKVTRDLTERRAREEAERSAALHAEASRLKDDFLAIVSHELRTPLNVAYGQAAMLRSRALPGPQADRAWESLLRNLKLQAQIIDDLLDISRIVAGKMSIERTAVDVCAIAREVVEEAAASAAAKGIRIELDTRDRSIVAGDPGRLRQMLGNLVSNAIKFTPSGGRVDVECTARNGEAVIAVKDTGIGIAPDFIDSIFERFSQADATTRREFGGLGLGLAITRELVARHGGTVSATSPGLGHGTTFVLTLPLAEAHLASTR